MITFMMAVCNQICGNYSQSSGLSTIKSPYYKLHVTCYTLQDFHTAEVTLNPNKQAPSDSICTTEVTHVPVHHLMRLCVLCYSLLMAPILNHQEFSGH